MERQTGLLQNIVYALDTEKSDTDSNISKVLKGVEVFEENPEEVILQNIEKDLNEYANFSKTIMYWGLAGIGILAF